MLQWTHEDGIFVIIDWGNAHDPELGIGDNQSLNKYGHNLSFQWHSNDLLSSPPYLPLSRSLDSEWTAVTTDLAQNTADLNAVKQICQNLGISEVGLQPIFRGCEWMQPSLQTRPVLWDGENYPSPGSPYRMTDGDKHAMASDARYVFSQLA